MDKLSKVVDDKGTVKGEFSDPKAAAAAAKAYGLKVAVGQTVKDNAQVARFFVSELGALDHEELHVLWLDDDFKSLGFELIGIGGKTQVEVPVQKILDRAKELNAKRFYITHNHPGDEEKPIPTIEDIKTTFLLGVIGARDAGINLQDHFVVGTHKYTSIVQEVLGMGSK